MKKRPSPNYGPKSNGKRYWSIIQDGLSSVLYDHHDKESHASQGWKRAWAAPHTPTMVYDPDRDEPTYEMALPAESGDEYVYFIHAAEVGRVKIGFSNDVEKRIAALRGSSPCKLSLIKLIPGGRDLERKIHLRFDAKRLDGEWFEDSVLDDWLRDPLAI